MIAPMTKYSLLVYHREYDEFLDKLRDLGVLHILEKEMNITDEIREKYQYIDGIDKTIRFLQRREVEPVQSGKEYSGQEIYNEVVDLQNEIEQHNNKLKALRKEIVEIEPWGRFSPEHIERLREKGIIIRFFVSPVRKFDPEWKEKYTIEEIGHQTGQIYFVVILRNDEEVDIQAEEISLPPYSVATLFEEKAKIKKKLESIESRFDHLAGAALPALIDYKRSLMQDLEYEKTRFNTKREAEDRLMVLEGWVPESSVKDVNLFLDGTGAVYITAEPMVDEKVPILLKNKGFAQKFEKLGELYSLPKYNELDMTVFFAPFYALFFGFCLGDAGYGILMTVASIIARRRVPRDFKPITVLVLYLGLATILFGLIGGTFFGISLYETDLPVYRNLAAMFKERGTDINRILFYLSVMLGAVQIIFGMFLKAVNETIQYGWKAAVGTYGWITLIAGSLLVLLTGRVAGLSTEALRPAQYTVLAVAGAMILLFNNLNRNVLVNFGLGLWNTYNVATGLLGDLLSYIRLFALGISSAILGFVFNSLAVSMSGSIPVVSAIVMVIILIIGHGINLFMSGLGSFVHPLRLTFVEFYKNAGFSGGGKRYDPFRKIQ